MAKYRAIGAPEVDLSRAPPGPPGSGPGPADADAGLPVVEGDFTHLAMRIPELMAGDAGIIKVP